MGSESLTLSPADIEALELSALIPALVQELRSSSVLEMSKREPCAMAMFKVIRALAARSATHYLLLKPTPAGEHSCIKNSLKTVSMDAKAITKFDKADALAAFIMETCNAVAKISKGTSLAALPPPGLGERKVSKQDGFKNYTRLLEPHRFGMFDGGFPTHKYLSDASTQKGTMKLLKRLQKEYVGLQTSLPVHPDASIFVRVDESQMTLAQICITPANGPYARGAFIFDVYFPPQYPAVPMKCNLATTGKNTFRFNPNLYQCGKVCLSLLGTWGGQGAENWDPRYSTLLQLCVSIMAQIFIEEPYFNEPGYESSRGTPHGTTQSNSYNNRVRVATVKFAMIDQLENPPKGFEYPVLTHFYLMKEAILEQVNGWLVDGKSTGVELDELKTLVPKLTTLLKELEMPEPPANEDSDSDSDDDDEKEEVAMEIVD
jgi:ubiquitin-protein ligase